MLVFGRQVVDLLWFDIKAQRRNTRGCILDASAGQRGMKDPYHLLL